MCENMFHMSHAAHYRISKRRVPLWWLTKVRAHNFSIALKQKTRVEGTYKVSGPVMNMVWRGYSRWSWM